MKIMIQIGLVALAIALLMTGEATARGGRGGGGGGRGGGGMSRPSPSMSRSPAMSRPSPAMSRPSTSISRPSAPAASRPGATLPRASQPIAGARPGTGAPRPSTGVRPGTGAVAPRDRLQCGAIPFRAGIDPTAEPSDLGLCQRLARWHLAVADHAKEETVAGLAWLDRRAGIAACQEAGSRGKVQLGPSILARMTLQTSVT